MAAKKADEAQAGKQSVLFVAECRVERRYNKACRALSLTESVNRILGEGFGTQDPYHSLDVAFTFLGFGLCPS